jgi:hypothetical protein
VVHKPYIVLFRIPFFLTLEYLEFSEKFCKTVLRPRFLLRNFYLYFDGNLTASDHLDGPDLIFEPTFFHFVSLHGAFAFWAQLWILLGHYHLAHNPLVSFGILYQAPAFDGRYHKDLAIELDCNDSNPLTSNQPFWGYLQQLWNDTCHFRINSLFCWTNILY